MLRWCLAVPFFAICALGLSLLERHSERATVDALIAEARDGLETAILEAYDPGVGARDAALALRGDAVLHDERIRRHLDTSLILNIATTGTDLVVRMDLSGDSPTVEAKYGIDGPSPILVAHSRSPIRPAALYPALAAIILAFATGKVIISLGVAVLLGAALATGANPAEMASHAARSYFWEATFTDTFKLWIIVFTCCLLGLVSLASRAGGIQGIVDVIAGRVRSAKGAQRATAAMGLAVFFDDYANTVLVGSTMRALSDRLRIAREKLAYLVDSTAAPIAGVALISTWIGFEIGLLSDAARAVGMEQDGYSLFLHALPFRFYCLFALVLVAVVVITGRDYGPMLRAEERAAHDGTVIRPGARPLSGGLDSDNYGQADESAPHMAHVALVPILTVLIGTVLGLFWDGGGFEAGVGALASFSAWRDAFGNAENSTFVMAAATLLGSALLFSIVLARRLLPVGETIRAYARGVRYMGPAVVILILAWAIGAVCNDLGADFLLVAVLGDAVPPLVVPLVVFLLAAVVAFSTGTSWGTMGIIIPVAVPLSFHIGGAPLTFVTMAAVLDGAIFGDHCSPISDTTVMSSIATGSDHMDHVRTQAPYALTSMTAAALFGYLWFGWGLPWWVGIAIGTAALVVFVRFAGRNAREGLTTCPKEAESAPT